MSIYKKKKKSLRNVATKVPVRTNTLHTIVTQRCQPPLMNIHLPH